MYIFCAFNLLEYSPLATNAQNLDSEGEIKLPEVNFQEELRKLISMVDCKIQEKDGNKFSMHFFLCFAKIMGFLLRQEKCVFEKAKLIKELLRILDILESISIANINSFQIKGSTKYTQDQVADLPSFVSNPLVTGGQRTPCCSEDGLGSIIQLIFRKAQSFDNEFLDFSFCNQLNDLILDKLAELRLGKSMHIKLKSVISFHLEFADLFSILEVLSKKSKNKRMTLKKQVNLESYYGV